MATPDSSSACSYHSGSPSRSACSTTASRPTRWITSCGGTLPLRKPGSFISPASCSAARSTRLASASGSTATSIFTRDSGRSVTVVFTRAASLVALRLSRWIPAGPRSAPGAAGASCTSASRSTRSGSRRLLRPGAGIDTVITADVYGAGACRPAARAGARGRRPRLLLPRRRGRPRLRRRRARRAPRLSAVHRPARCAAPTSTPATCAGRPRPASSGSGSRPSTCCCSTTPTAPGSPRRPSGTGWRRSRRRTRPTRSGSRPGPANGFTLDLIDCFERFGDRIDWAMVILNPLEPWPGELCLGAAAAQRRAGDHPGRRLRRPVLGRRPPGPRVRRARPPPLPPRRLGRGRPRAARADAADRRAPPG